LTYAPKNAKMTVSTYLCEARIPRKHKYQREISSTSQS